MSNKKEELTLYYQQKKPQHLKYKIINRFKGKEWENDMKKNQKKYGPAILIPNQVYFRTSHITNDQERDDIIKKSLMCMHLATEFQHKTKIDRTIRRNGQILTTLSVINRACTQNISENINDQNITIRGYEPPLSFKR